MVNDGLQRLMAFGSPSPRPVSLLPTPQPVHMRSLKVISDQIMLTIKCIDLVTVIGCVINHQDFLYTEMVGFRTKHDRF